MSFWGLLKKTMIENIRDWKILILTLIFAPFFLGLMYFYFESETVNTYRVLVINRDIGHVMEDGKKHQSGADLINQLKRLKSTEGDPFLDLRERVDEKEARRELKNQGADLIIKIPENFSSTLAEHQKGNTTTQTTVRTIGDTSNGKYMMAAVWCDMTIYQFAEKFTQKRSPLILESKTLGKQNVATLSDFELYIPGMLVMALIMIMFTAAASLIKEKDTGTIVRLRLSGVSPIQWFSAITIIQVVIGLLAMGLTLLTAMGLGYHFSSSITAFVVVGIISSMAIMAISVVVSAYLRTIFDLMTIGCFPFFILIFFSGAMFPLPKLRIFSLGIQPVHINDILPVTHSIGALNKILNQQGTIGDVLFELGAIIFLSTLFFIWGAWLFNKRHLQPQ